MRQLQLFTPAALAEMRDRTAARNYSPAREQFRREHARHRTWGLIQRHAQRLARQHHKSCTHAPAPRSQRETADATPPAQNSQPTHPEHSGRDHHTPDPATTHTGQRAAPAAITDTRPARPHPETHNTGARLDQRATKIHIPPVRQVAVKNRKSASLPNWPAHSPLSTPDSGQHLSAAHPQGVKYGQQRQVKSVGCPTGALRTICGPLRRRHWGTRSLRRFVALEHRLDRYTHHMADAALPAPPPTSKLRATTAPAHASTATLTQTWAGRAPRRVRPREQRSGPRRTSRQLKASDSLEWNLSKNDQSTALIKTS